MKKLLSEIAWLIGGVVLMVALILFLFGREAKAEEVSIEEQYAIQTQYLKATDDALYILNRCGTFYTLLVALNEENPKLEEIKAFVNPRVISLGTSLGYVLWNAEYYFPHVYGFDSNNEAAKKIFKGYLIEIHQNPTAIATIMSQNMAPCERVFFGEQFFAEYVQQFPLVKDSWPAYPGREPPPEGWISPSMKRAKELWRREENPGE